MDKQKHTPGPSSGAIKAAEAIAKDGEIFEFYRRAAEVALKPGKEWEFERWTGYIVGHIIPIIDRETLAPLIPELTERLEALTDAMSAFFCKEGYVDADFPTGGAMQIEWEKSRALLAKVREAQG